MIVTRTPFRVSFLGGGTDYAPWYREHGGAVLSCTIGYYCYLSVKHLPPFFSYRHRVAWSELEYVREVSEIRHPAVRAILEHLRPERGLSITHDGDLPARSGLGSSSAFTVGLLHALHALAGRMPARETLAREAVHIEQEVMGETVGLQDQVACAYGGLNAVRIDREGGWTVAPVTLPAERLRDLERHLLLYFTGTQRHSSIIAAQQVSRLHQNESSLHDLAAMVGEGVEILASAQPLAAFGRLLDEAWQVKRCLAPGVSTPEIDAMYATARKWGAAGGKLLGAGGGGFLLLLARPEDQGALRAALSGALEVPFRFDWTGSGVIHADGP